MEDLKLKLLAAINNSDANQVVIELTEEEIEHFIDEADSLCYSFVEMFSEEYGIDIIYSDLEDDKLTVEVSNSEEEEEEETDTPF